MALQATHYSYRFIVLLFTCLLTFGSYFCYDMPSVLQAQFQQNVTCTISNSSNVSGLNTSCCADCLGMSPDSYNLLYAIYAWTNAVIVIAAGYLIDKLGNRVGLFLFSFLCLAGSSLFAIGSMYPGSSIMLPVMLTGRLVFGAGNGSLTVVQYRLIAFWFRNKELALAFGTVLAFSRLGSVMNFLLTEHIYDSFGLVWTLWGGTMLVGLGFLSAIIVNILDTVGTRQLGQETNMKLSSKNVKFSDIRHFNLQFWLLVLTLMTFYNGVFPFVADASKFIQDKYDYSAKTAAYMAGAVYDVSMVLSPFLGGVVDIIGKRGYISLACAIATIPVYAMLAFSMVHPLVSTLWLGITYSFAAPSLWPSIPLVVSAAHIGTANGIATSVQMVGIGICNVIVGQLLGEDSEQPGARLLQWKYVMIFLFCNTLLCVTFASLIIIVDRRRGNVLNQSRAERLMKERLDAAKRQDHSGTPSATYNDSEPSETDALLPPTVESSAVN